MPVASVVPVVGAAPGRAIRAAATPARRGPSGGHHSKAPHQPPGPVVLAARAPWPKSRAVPVARARAVSCHPRARGRRPSTVLPSVAAPRARAGPPPSRLLLYRPPRRSLFLTALRRTCRGRGRGPGPFPSGYLCCAAATALSLLEAGYLCSCSRSAIVLVAARPLRQNERVARAPSPLDECCSPARLGANCRLRLRIQAHDWQVCLLQHYARCTDRCAAALAPSAKRVARARAQVLPGAIESAAATRKQFWDSADAQR